MYSASFSTIFWRFNLMMVLVVVPFAIGVPILALLSCPVFLITILGISFKSKKVYEQQKSATVYPENYRNYKVWKTAY